MVSYNRDTSSALCWKNISTYAEVYTEQGGYHARRCRGYDDSYF